MHYENFGPFEMPVDQRGDFAIDDGDAPKTFFAQLEDQHRGISEGRGCYVSFPSW